MFSKHRAFVVAFAAHLLVSCGASETAAPEAPGLMTAAGGTVAKADGSVSLTVPANALAQSTTIALSKPASYPTLGTLAPGTPVMIEPAALTFTKQATLSIRYDAATLPSAVNESGLQLYVLIGNSWQLLGASVVNTTSKMVSGVVSGGGTYAVLESPVDHITLTGSLKDNALYTGLSSVLTATSYSNIYGENNPLRMTNWRSSDPTRATVDATGKVTGVSPGSVTITAFGGGQTASTTIDILSRPIADLSQATDWTTFQGTATHSGYVPVTIDPTVFVERWTTTPIASASALHPVVEKDGLVFASSRFYEGGTGRVVGIDASSGQVKWSQPLPQSGFGTFPVAVGDGAVYLQTLGPPGYLRSFEATTGAPRFAVPYTTQWDVWRAPAVVGSTVFMGCGYLESICAHRTSDGSPLWSAGVSAMNEWTPTVGNGYAYLDEGEKIGVFNASDGGLAFEMPNPYDNGGGINTLALGSVNNLLVITSWHLYAFDLTQKKALWMANGSFHQNLTVGNGVAYVRTDNRLEAHSEADGSLLWSWTPPDGAPVGSTILTRNLLFVSSPRTTYAIDVASHKTVWSYPVGGGSLSLGRQGMLFIAPNDGRLVALQAQ